MSNLKLITTEKLGDLDCNFYRNMNDDILLTKEQIGFLLEYVNPMVATRKIYKYHLEKYNLDAQSEPIKVTTIFD